MADELRVLPSGTHGLLLELDSLDAVLDRYAALRSATHENTDLGVLDLVPAGRTILVVADRGTDLAALEKSLLAVEPVARDESSADVIEVPVTYDGEDLADVAEALGCSVDELVRRHQDETWTVAFCGFAPGFGYLSGSSFAWSVPRRSSPRIKVPARSVAMAGEFSAVYPRESPGGWQLIGTAHVEVLDLDRDPPGLLLPGMQVRFVEAS
ncbi:5-oxoprolinase subunit B family protein [Ornithinimicrobium panacihumi]|uniref:5-oxoprolinase subunit B family protein n=1 Tax=Ornithinimicrobium panacihumi TaxID=2008449 RepID=UPI003F891B14